jgi:hypothetical protein
MARGIGSVRVDKRGMFGSRAAVADPNAVTITIMRLMFIAGRP